MAPNVQVERRAMGKSPKAPDRKSAFLRSSIGHCSKLSYGTLSQTFDHARPSTEALAPSAPTKVRASQCEWRSVMVTGTPTMTTKKEITDHRPSRARRVLSLDGGSDQTWRSRYAGSPPIPHLGCIPFRRSANPNIMCVTKPDAPIPKSRIVRVMRTT